MKKVYLLLFMVVLCSSMFAQMPQGGGGPQGGERPDGAPMMRGDMNQEEESVGVIKLPDIPELTEKQREKLIDNLSKERKNVSSLMEDKNELNTKMDNDLDMSGDEVDKYHKNLAKIDAKIDKTKEKYDKKYRSILTAEQYAVFSEKKSEVQFRNPRREFRARNQSEGDSPDFEGRGMNRDMPEDMTPF